MENDERGYSCENAGSRFVAFGTGLASNAWVICKTMIEQGRSAFLANSDFPYTEHCHLLQAQLIVADYLDVGLLGTAIPIINLNRNLPRLILIPTAASLPVTN